MCFATLSILCYIFLYSFHNIKYRIHSVLEEKNDDHLKTQIRILSHYSNLTFPTIYIFAIIHTVYLEIINDIHIQSLINNEFISFVDVYNFY